MFCGFQMLGTNPFGLVVCLHKYKKEDRERRGLYSFEVIDVFEDVCRYIDSRSAMIVLEKMRRYWNSYPQKILIYIHELCHMFGGDASVSFSQALTYAIELLMENHALVLEAKAKWAEIFANIKK